MNKIAENSSIDGLKEKVLEFKYVIVTPVKNEEKFLPITIASVISQTILPKQWIIINDGSTDKTGGIIRMSSAKHNWIQGIDNPDKPSGLSRRIGGQAVLHLGLQKINVADYDFVVRMDSDLSFSATFFRQIFEEFKKNPKLGIASGVCWVKDNASLVEEKHPRFHTRGPLKVYRAECFQQIGGLDPEEGWDTIDEMKAHMHGWETWSFPHLKVIHLRKTQTASGVLKGFRNRGRTAYYVGYHPIFAMLRSLRSMFQKPYLLGGVHLFLGFIEGYLKREPVVQDKSLIRYIRQQQVNRLLGRETVWR